MKRFTTAEWEDEDTGCLVQGGPVEHTYGEYVLYEDVEPIIADRDIKAANLKTLVDTVLVWETQDSVFQVAPEVQNQWGELIALARGLKQ